MRLQLKEKGVGYAILAPFLYAMKSVAIKLAPAANLEFFVFFRFLIDLLILTPFFIRYKAPFFLRAMPFHFFRGALAMASIYCSVFAVRNLTLVDAILLENTLPLFVPLLIWIFQAKKISKKSLLILLIGFSSLCFLLKPKFDLLHLASLAGIGAALASGGSSVIVSVVSRKESALAILYYFNVFGCCLSFFPFYLEYQGMPSLSDFLPFILISLFGVAGQYAVTKAYSLISAHIAGSFFYLSVLFSALFGIIIWNEKIDGIQLFGGILLVGSGLLMIRESRWSALASKRSLPQKQAGSLKAENFDFLIK